MSGKEYCKDYTRCSIKNNKKDCPINPENNISCCILLENKCRLSMLATQVKYIYQKNKNALC